MIAGRTETFSIPVPRPPGRDHPVGGERMRAGLGASSVGLRKGPRGPTTPLAMCQWTGRASQTYDLQVLRRLALFLLLHVACVYPNPGFELNTSGSGAQPPSTTSSATNTTTTTTRPTSGSGSGSDGDSSSMGATTGPCGSGACLCEPDLAEPCYEGPPGSEDVGLCSSGTRVCAADGSAWGPCNDAVVPTPELCGNNLDDNCDDIVDEPSCDGPCPALPGLVACYLFPEGETSQLVDGSGNGHHGVMSAVELVDGAPQQGRAGAFSARSEATLPDDPPFNPEHFTIAMLAAPAAAGGEVTLVDKDNQFVVLRSGGSISCLVVNSDGKFAGVSVQAANDTWSHIACAFDGKEISLWRHDGGEVMDSGSLSGSLGKSSGGGIQVGKNSPELDKAYLGKLDRVLFFDRALTGAEVCALAGPLCP